MKKELISVIIPTYNRGYIISKAIDSILNQTYNNLELIIVDDCSDDDTKKIVKSYNDSRIKYYKLKKRSGACKARNFGVSKAKGLYVCFNDSDDVYLENKIEEQYNNIIKNKSDMDICKINVYSKDGCELLLTCPIEEQVKWIKENKIVEHLVDGNFISTQAVLIKKEVFDKYKFDNDLPRLQDFDLFLRMIPNIKCSISEDVLVHLYRQDNSISSSNTNLYNAIKIINSKDYNFSKKLKNHLVNFLIKIYYGDLNAKAHKVYENILNKDDNKANKTLLLSDALEKMKNEVVIKVDSMTKSFRLFYDKPTTLKERLVFWNHKKAEHRVVLNNINLEINKGETIALIGVNGSGKSTLLKLMTKIIYPTSGSVETKGKLTSLLELGAGFHPDFTGRENIYFNASIFGLTKKEIDSRIDDIIEFSELEEFIDNPVRTYSSGQYMRLAFSIAINVDAEILLIDEILAVGDAHFQDKCFNKLEELAKSDKTIVIVSHNLNSIRKLCNRGIWIHEGKICADGNINQVCDEYIKNCG